MEKREKSTYTLLRHVVGENHNEFTGIQDIQIKIDGDATVSEMASAFKSFLLAVGYHLSNVEEYLGKEE